MDTSGKTTSPDLTEFTHAINRIGKKRTPTLSLTQWWIRGERNGRTILQLHLNYEDEHGAAHRTGCPVYLDEVEKDPWGLAHEVIRKLRELIVNRPPRAEEA